MKGKIASLIAGLMLGTAGIAGASSSAPADMHANGVWCKPGAGGIACVVTDGSRYGIGISKSVVMVYDTRTERTAWSRAH